MNPTPGTNTCLQCGAKFSPMAKTGRTKVMRLNAKKKYCSPKCCQASGKLAYYARELVKKGYEVTKHGA